MSEGNRVTESRAAFGRRVGWSGQYVGRLARHGYIALDQRGCVRVDASLRRLRNADKLPAASGRNDLDQALAEEVDREIGHRHD